MATLPIFDLRKLLPISYIVGKETVSVEPHSGQMCLADEEGLVFIEVVFA
jgi:hypothetical protein